MMNRERKAWTWRICEVDYGIQQGALGSDQNIWSLTWITLLRSGIGCRLKWRKEQAAQASTRRELSLATQDFRTNAITRRAEWIVTSKVSLKTRLSKAWSSSWRFKRGKATFSNLRWSRGWELEEARKRFEEDSTGESKT